MAVALVCIILNNFKFQLARTEGQELRSQFNFKAGYDQTEMRLKSAADRRRADSIPVGTYEILIVSGTGRIYPEVIWRLTP